MTTVVLSSYKVANFPEGGGHFWVYMQYAQALRRVGCEVYWLEHLRSTGDRVEDARLLSAFRSRMEAFGLGERLLLYIRPPGSGPEGVEFLGTAPDQAAVILDEADLLLNFHYALDPTLLRRFRRSALVDIDPGLLQFWMNTGQLQVEAHDVYFTTGETVGTSGALFSDCGLRWVHIRPPVCLDLWPYVHNRDSEAFTTVSNWQGSDWIREGDVLWENTKRVSFLQFMELPSRTPQILELALYLTDQDAEARRDLERHGWRIRLSREVAGSPQHYQTYVQTSRGEFSCAKPSCMKFQNAWISDRSLCYLASGKPVVVQDTGPSNFLPSGEGIFRFSTIEQAIDALATINRDYERHCRAARALAETCFDGKQIVQRMLESALG